VPLIALIPLAFATPSPRTYSSHSYYVLHHNAKSHMTPSECAHALGAQLVEQVGELDDHWLVRIEAEPPAGDNLYRRDDDELIQRLNIHKRSPNNALASSVRSLTRQVPRQRIKKRAPPHSPPSDLVPTVSSSSVVASKLGIKDPIFPDQWHNVNDKFPGFDLNVSGVWEMGITGKGVISAVVDDGLDANSKDLADNFVRTFFKSFIAPRNSRHKIEQRRFLGL
jgi:kexin